VEIRFKGGRILADELAVANAHPLGARPFTRANYVEKFKTLTAAETSEREASRFLEVAQRLPQLRAPDLGGLNVVADKVELKHATRDTRGVF
jgi:2-methylcitrate dehydratase